MACIITNQEYGKTIMANLPAVKDDHKNIRQTVLMLGVPDKKDENIFELVDGTWQQTEDLHKKVDG